MNGNVLAIVIAFLTVGIYGLLKYIYSFWHRHGFQELQPSFLFGNLKQSSLLRTSIAEEIKGIYDSTTKPFIGFYMFFQPALLLRDLDVLKTIWVKEFDSFLSRGFHSDPENDPLSGHILAMQGEEWRQMRQKMSMSLTSGKLKHMMPVVVTVADKLRTFLENVADRPVNNNVEIKNLCACYTSDVIASFAFGLEIDCINNPKEKFREMGMKIADPNLEGKLRASLQFMAPFLCRIFKIKAANADVNNFFISTVRKVIEHREANNVVRPDLLQLLIQVRNTGNVNDDGDWQSKIVAENQKKLTVEQIAAQTFSIFTAGFETTSTMMMFFIFEISKHPEIQAKLQENVDAVLAKYDGKITYEGLKEMKYLAKVSEETLRMYPSVPYMQRVCTTAFKLPNTNQTIPKGAAVAVSIMGMHHDPNNFENPTKFDPERFSPENRRNIKPMSYFPFGDGPRICVGMRLAILKSSAALATMISNFQFKLADSQTENIKFDPNGLFLAPQGGIQINVQRRQKP